MKRVLICIIYLISTKRVFELDLTGIPHCQLFPSLNTQFLVWDLYTQIIYPSPLLLIFRPTQRTQFILNSIVTSNKDLVNYNLQEIFHRRSRQTVAHSEPTAVARTKKFLINYLRNLFKTLFKGRRGSETDCSWRDGFCVHPVLCCQNTRGFSYYFCVCENT